MDIPFYHTIEIHMTKYNNFNKNNIRTHSYVLVVQSWGVKAGPCQSPITVWMIAIWFPHHAAMHRTLNNLNLNYLISSVITRQWNVSLHYKYSQRSCRIQRHLSFWTWDSNMSKHSSSVVSFHQQDEDLFRADVGDLLQLHGPKLKQRAHWYRVSSLNKFKLDVMKTICLQSGVEKSCASGLFIQCPAEQLSKGLSIWYLCSSTGSSWPSHSVGTPPSV